MSEPMSSSTDPLDPRIVLPTLVLATASGVASVLLGLPNEGAGILGLTAVAAAIVLWLRRDRRLSRAAVARYWQQPAAQPLTPPPGS